MWLIFDLMLLAFIVAAFVHEIGWYKCLWDYTFGRNEIWRLVVFAILFCLWSVAVVIDIGKMIG